MIVGICELELNLYDMNSLKDKRQIIKSLIGRIRSRFNVSIAEIGYLDMWNRSIIGFSYVANEKSYVESGMRQVINFIDNDHRVHIVNEYIEIL